MKQVRKKGGQHVCTKYIHFVLPQMSDVPGSLVCIQMEESSPFFSRNGYGLCKGVKPHPQNLPKIRFSAFFFLVF